MTLNATAAMLPAGDALPALDHATAARVMRIVSAELGFGHAVLGQPLNLNSRLSEDLNIDSLTRVVIAADIEDHFDIAISDDALAAAQTVSDLIGLVAVRLMGLVPPTLSASDEQ